MSNYGWGSTGQVLTSNGTGVMPSFQASGGGGGITTYFAAYLSTTPTGTSFDPLIYDTIITNVGGGYDNTTGLFTCPTGQAGIYFFNASFALTGLTSAATDLIFLIYSTSPYYQIGLMFFNPYVVSDPPEGNDLNFSVAGMAPLADGQTVQVRLSINNSTELNGATSFQFSGFRIGA